MPAIIAVIAGLLGILIGIGVGYVLRRRSAQHSLQQAEEEARQIVVEAETRTRELEREGGHSGLNARELAGEEPPRIELPLNAGIPDGYIEHLPTRLSVYQRLARLTERRELPDIREELRDRFGPVPEEVENLLRVSEVRAIAGKGGAESVIRNSESIVITLRNPVGGAKAPLQRALGPLAQVGNAQIQMPLRPLGDQWLSRLTRTLERLQVFTDNMRQLAADAATGRDADISSIAVEQR